MKRRFSFKLAYTYWAHTGHLPSLCLLSILPTSSTGNPCSQEHSGDVSPTKYILGNPPGTEKNRNPCTCGVCVLVQVTDREFARQRKKARKRVGERDQEEAEKRRFKQNDQSLIDT